MAIKRKEQPTKIFQYRNLGDFEKVLYLEHQVKWLLGTIKSLKIENGVLASEVEEAKYNNSETVKLKNQRTQLDNLAKGIRRVKLQKEKLEVEYHKLNVKYQTLKSK